MMRTNALFLRKRMLRVAKSIDARRRRINILSAALAFAGELAGIGVKQKTGVVSLKAQHHLNTTEARRIWRTKTRKGYRHH